MLTPNSTYKILGVTVNEKIIPDNGTVKKANKKLNSVKYITIHNTEDLAGVYDDAEQYTRATYNGAMGNTVVHFYVDDVGAWQNLKAGLGLCGNDPKNSAEVGWHVADSDDSTGGNNNSISIEIIMNESTETDKKAYDNGARLAAYLLNYYGLSIDKLVTHTYWGNYGLGKKFTDVDKQCTNPNSGYRWCPYYIFNSSNSDIAYKNWKAFKSVVQGYMKTNTTSNNSNLQSTTQSQSDTKFTPRLTTPEKTNKYYLTKSYGGYSPCINRANGFVLPNCVGYAVGRFNEIANVNSCKYLKSTNAEDMIDARGDLKYGSTPKLGACAVWRKGKQYNSADGFGHVAIVEKIVSTTEIITSESNYYGDAFYTKTRNKGNGNWGMDSSYTFLGFIYQPIEYTTNTTTSTLTTELTSTTTSTNTFKIGDIVYFKGGYHYASSSAPSGYKRTMGNAKITNISNGAKHPYHLVGVSGGSNVYGWVDTDSFSSLSSSTTTTTKNKTFKVGDKIKVKSGAKTYDGKNLASFVYLQIYTIMEISGERVVIGQNGKITAAVKISDLQEV